MAKAKTSKATKQATLKKTTPAPLEQIDIPGMEQPEEEGDPITDDLYELNNICINLWERYFAAPKKDKAPLMAQYNVCATAYNKKAGWGAMRILDSTMKDTLKNRPVHPPVVLSAEEQAKQTAAEVTPKPKKEGSIIEQILALHKAGKTNKEIIAAGFNKSTVGRQVSEYKKKTENK